MTISRLLTVLVGLCTTATLASCGTSVNCQGNDSSSSYCGGSVTVGNAGAASGSDSGPGSGSGQTSVEPSVSSVPTTSRKIPASTPAKPTGGAAAPAAAPLKLTALDVSLPGNYGKRGTGLYQITHWSNEDIVVEYTWLAHTNYGDLTDGSNCDVVGTAHNKSDNSVVDSPDYSAQCRPNPRLSVRLPVGSYTLDVQLKYQGQTVSNNVDITVIPYSS